MVKGVEMRMERGEMRGCKGKKLRVEGRDMGVWKGEKREGGRG